MRNASPESKRLARPIFQERICYERRSGKRKRGFFENSPEQGTSRSTSRPAWRRLQKFEPETLVADPSIEQEPQQLDRGISPQRNRQTPAALCATQHRDFSAFDSEDGLDIRRLAKAGGNSE